MFADGSMFSSPFAPYIAVMCGIVAISIGIFVYLMKNYYISCNSSQLLVIFGKLPNGEEVKVMHGGSTFVYPLIQDYRFLDLAPISVDVRLDNVPFAGPDRVRLRGEISVAIGTMPDLMKIAAKRWLDYPTTYIQKEANEILHKQLRQLLASMTAEEIRRNSESFIQRINESIEPDLREVGLVATNITIDDIQIESSRKDSIAARR